MGRPPINRENAPAIRTLRMASGLTQQQLADAAGVAIRLIQRYEWGETPVGNMPLETAIAIAKALNTTPDKLI